MARVHHHAFSRRLPGLFLRNPDRILAELRGPMREAFLMYLWTEIGRDVGAPLPHVDIGTRGGHPELRGDTPHPEVIALNVVAADVRQGTEIVVVQMPPAVEPNESWFFALTRANGVARAFGYERTDGSDAVLSELLENGHSNFGFFPDVTLDGFLRALGGLIGVPLQGLSVPTSSPVDAVRAARAAPAAPPEKKSIWPPLLLALLFLLPGLLTFSFALHEATRFGSDWVMISLPLLVAAGLSVTWMMARALGRTGAFAGALVAATALGSACVVLKGNIDDRAEHRRNYEALQATRTFCEGHGAANRRARPYVAGHGPHPTVVFANLDGPSVPFSTSSDRELRSWAPEPYAIQQAELVACVRRIDKKVETCPYEQGSTIDRVETTLEVALYAIASGDKIFETKMPGAPPRACQLAEKFYADSHQSSITGEPPPLSEVRRVLAPHVEH